MSARRSIYSRAKQRRAQRQRQHQRRPYKLFERYRRIIGVGDFLEADRMRAPAINRRTSTINLDGAEERRKTTITRAYGKTLRGGIDLVYDNSHINTDHRRHGRSQRRAADDAWVFCEPTRAKQCGASLVGSFKTKRFALIRVFREYSAAAGAAPADMSEPEAEAERR